MSQQQPTYGSPEAVMAVGISYRQLDYWSRTRVVLDPRQDDLLRPGSGYNRPLSLHLVQQLAVVKASLDLGLNLPVAREVAVAYREITAYNPIPEYLVLAGHDPDRAVHSVQHAAELPGTLETLDTAFVVLPLRALLNRVEARLAGITESGEHPTVAQLAGRRYTP